MLDRKGDYDMKVRKHNVILKKLCLTLVAMVLTFSVVELPARPALSMESFIVQGANADEVVDLVEDYGGSVTSRLELINGVAALLPRSAADRLQATPGITALSPNVQVQTTGKSYDPPIPGVDYAQVTGADLTWSQGETGTGVTVAIVDTGLANHQGLFKDMSHRPGGRISGWIDIVDGKNNPHDPNGHGTHIAGIIANSQSPVEGDWNSISPGVNIVGVRVLNEEGYGTYEQVIQGIQWVITHREELNIKVMNLSLISNARSPYWADPLNQAVMQAWAHGITVVVAAGNDGPGPMTIGVPGNNPYVITVGAFTDSYTPEVWGDDYITPFSSAGPTLDGFVKPDLVAPGAHMASIMMPSSYTSRHHEANRLSAQYFSMAGTSQAAAVVSGVSALTLAQNPDLTPDEVKFRLLLTAFPWIDLQSTDALYSAWQQGAGRVNAPDAVFADIEGSANSGMDILAELAGQVHYEGFSYFDEASGEFRLRGEYQDWTGGYGNWAGAYGNWAGGYGNWAGAYGNWAGAYGNWAGGYGNWAGAYGNWAGAYGNWAGAYGNWAGAYGNWAGGYGNWAGGYGNWAGAYGDAKFAETFVNWTDSATNWSNANISGGIWIEYDD
jgi:serine protease AprX